MKLEKRYKFLILSILTIVIASSIAIITVAPRYTWKTQILIEDGEEISDIGVVVDNENILNANPVIKRSDSFNGYKEIEIELEGKKPGSSLVEVTFGNNREFSYFSVGLFNFVFDETERSFNGYQILIIAVFSVIVLCTAVMISSFVKKRRRGEFSYSLIALGGLILYTLTHIMVLGLVLGISYGFDINLSLYEFNIVLITMGDDLSIILYPVIFILFILISISNIFLMFREGFRPFNMLGAAFGFIMIASATLLFIYVSRDIAGSESEVKVYESINAVLSYIFAYLECMLISTMICAVKATRYKVPYNKDYIIILGCAINADGTPMPLLKGRIDRAIEFEKAQYESTGKHACFVPSGGQGSDEIISECESMKRYLISNGVDEGRILEEDKSVNTLQNMTFSKELIEQREGKPANDVNVAFSTTNYHVLRGYILARKFGMRVHGLSAKTKNYFYPNAFIREFFGLLFEEKFKHALFVMIIIAFYILLIYFS